MVEDFVCKIQGLRPGQKAKGTTETEHRFAFYGGRIVPDTRRSPGQYTNIEDETSLSNSYPKDSKIEITLKPQSALIDGSTGATITERLRMGDEGTWTYMMGSIPIGIYTATAKIITPEGTVVPVRCTVREEGKDIDKTPWAASARINFPNTPNEFGASVTLYLAKP